VDAFPQRDMEVVYIQKADARLSSKLNVLVLSELGHSGREIRPLDHFNRCLKLANKEGAKRLATKAAMAITTPKA
jgi:hypothetical protein